MKEYRFDKVFAKGIDQKGVFQQAQVDKMIDKVIEGYHATIFAYGQTGSGKTYTMEGYNYKADPRTL